MTSKTADDERAIRDLAARYSDAVNRHSAGDMVAVYAEDGILTGMDGRDIAGHAALQALFTSVLADHQWILQSTTNGIVRIDGDRAECRWWILENGLRKDGGGTVFMGCYEDVVLRGPSGWRFARRSLKCPYIGRQQFAGKTFPPATYRELY